MSRTLLSFICISFFLFISTLSSQSPFSSKLIEMEGQFEQMEQHAPFSRSNAKAVSKLFRQAQFLDFDIAFLKQTLKKKSNLLNLNLPLNGEQNLILNLQTAPDFGKGTIVRYSSGKTSTDLDDYQYYWGIVKGDNNSSVSITVTKGQLYGVVIYNGHTYNLGKIKHTKDYIIYDKIDLIDAPTTDCYTDQLKQQFAPNNDRNKIAANVDNCVNLYVEVDNDIYVDKGSNTVGYITAVFAEVAQLYANEAINFGLSEIVVWDTADPYTGPSTNNYLTQFRSALGSSYNGDLAHLVGYQGGGGIAYVDVVCNKSFGFGYSDINSSYQSVPTYSWTIEVLTHEIGHNLGSPHTHSCSWNGNNTQIDDCGNIYLANNGGNPGSCYDPGNQIVPNAGTIMSYCHLVGGVGIDFNLGFSQQPGDLIRDRIYNATCLSTCGSNCTPGNACDDNDICTYNDVYDASCNCAGTFADADADTVCDAEDICPGGDDLADADGDGVPDFCDDCTNVTVPFSPSALTHSGTGSSTSNLTFSTLADGVGFSINDLNAKVNGNPNSRYIDKVTVNYVNDAGNSIVHGSYLGTDFSSVDIEIIGLVSSISVILEDGYDGNSSTTLNVNLTDANSCPTDTCPDSDGDTVCDVDDVCPGGDDTVDLNGNNIPDDCENTCIAKTDAFNANPLTHSGSGSSNTTLNLEADAQDVSFTISGLGSKTNGNPNSRYIDLVNVDYQDGSGTTVNYGNFRGDNVSSVTVTISGLVQSLTVSLSDAYDGNSGNISVDFSTVDYCVLSSPMPESIIAAAPMNETEVFPNPFTSQLTIKVSQKPDASTSITVFDLSGRVILKPQSFAGQEYLLDTNEITEEGIYILKLESSDGQISQHRIMAMR